MLPTLQHYFIRKPRLSQFLLTAFRCNLICSASSPLNYWKARSYNPRIEEDTIFVYKSCRSTNRNKLFNTRHNFSVTNSVRCPTLYHIPTVGTGILGSNGGWDMEAYTPFFFIVLSRCRRLTSG